MIARRATSGQRDYIRNLIRKLDWDPRTVTLQHRAVLTQVGIGSEEGQAIDELLDSLEKHQASRLIAALDAAR